QNVSWTFTPASGNPQSGQGAIIGNGNTVNNSFRVSDVGPAGVAHIALQYQPASGNPVSATLQMTVVPAGSPTVIITNPPNNGTAARSPVQLNASVTFVARVTDDVAIVAQNLGWTLTSPSGAANTYPGSFAGGFNNTGGDATLAANLTEQG